MVHSRFLHRTGRARGLCRHRVRDRHWSLVWIFFHESFFMSSNLSPFKSFEKCMHLLYLLSRSFLSLSRSLALAYAVSSSFFSTFSRSWDVGFDFHSEADAGTLRGTPAGDAYHSLPPTHRVDLDVRQFVFLLAPSPPLLAPPLAGFPFASNSSASAGEAGAHNVAPLDAGANAAAGSSAVHSFVQDASAAPSVTSGNNSPNRASSTGPDAPQGATVAIAIITASPVQDERLAQVCTKILTSRYSSSFF